MNDEEISFLWSNVFNYICLHIYIFTFFCFICPPNYHDDSLLFWSTRVQSREAKFSQLHGITVLSALFSSFLALLINLMTIFDFQKLGSKMKGRTNGQNTDISTKFTQNENSLKNCTMSLVDAFFCYVYSPSQGC